MKPWCPGSSKDLVNLKHGIIGGLNEEETEQCFLLSDAWGLMCHLVTREIVEGEGC